MVEVWSMVVVVAVVVAVPVVVVVVVAMAVETMAKENKSLNVPQCRGMETLKDKHTSKEISQTLVADQIYLKG